MGQLNYRIIFFLTVVLLCSCQNQEQKTYYENGNIRAILYYNEEMTPVKREEFYLDGKVKSESHYKSNHRGSSKVFYGQKGEKIATQEWINQNECIQKTYHANRKIKSKGTLYKNLKTGWWSYFDVDGNVIRKEEIVIINGKEILNQRILYDSAGKIIEEKSEYFHVVLPDTVSEGKSTGKIKYTSVAPTQSTFYVYVGYDINDDFSNVGQVKLDTFFSSNKKDIWFGVDIKGDRNNVIRGIIEESYYEVNEDSTDLVISKKSKYFQKKVVVMKQK